MIVSLVLQTLSKSKFGPQPQLQHHDWQGGEGGCEGCGLGSNLIWPQPSGGGWHRCHSFGGNGLHFGPLLHMHQS